MEGDMMPKRTGGKPPPEPVYQLGKKKERASNLLRFLKSVRNDLSNSNTQLITTLENAIEDVQEYRNNLDKP